ncbi:MAG: hypothetical protein AB7P20_09455 [Rhizobiaceae bacterium]
MHLNADLLVVDEVNDNVRLPSRYALARTAAARRAAEKTADQLLAANDNEPPKKRIRSRSLRPAWNWLKKEDKRAAAALWLFARRMLPEAANDNVVEPGLTSLDRRRDGKPRGPNKNLNEAQYAPRPVDPTLPLWRGKIDGGYLARRRPNARVLCGTEAHLAQPGVRARLGDLESAATTNYSGWHSGVFAIKPQRPAYPFHPDCRFGYCAPAIAEGATFLGAAGGLGKAKAGKRKGDVRKVDEQDLPNMPDRIFLTIELMLARADLAGVGRAHGYKGGYADRVGKRAMREAGRWALDALKTA